MKANIKFNEDDQWIWQIVVLLLLFAGVIQISTWIVKLIKFIF